MKETMNPPVRWKYLAAVVVAAAVFSALVTALVALATWSQPASGWAWPIFIGTCVIAPCLLIRDMWFE